MPFDHRGNGVVIGPDSRSCMALEIEKVVDGDGYHIHLKKDYASSVWSGSLFAKRHRKRFASSAQLA